MKNHGSAAGRPRPRRRLTPALLIAALTAVLALVTAPSAAAEGSTSAAGSPPATAAPYPPPPCPVFTAVLDHATGGSTPSLTVTGSGFVPNTGITLTLNSQPRVLGSVKADASGAFSQTFPLPADLPPGTHTVSATGRSCGTEPSFVLTSAPSTWPAPPASSWPAPSTSSKSLASTGVAVAGFGIGGFILVAGGVLLVVLGRRRRHAH